MPFPVTNPGTAPSWSSATNWGDIRWNINNQIDLIAKYYDKPTIDEMLAQLWGSGKMVVVDALPATWEDWFIYLLSHDGTWNPPFDMYIWTQDNTFQLIWDTTIDLSNVYTKQEANERFQIQLIAGDLINLTDTGIISVKNVYNKTEVDDLIEAIDTVKMLVVPALPTVWRVNVIYLTPTEDPNTYEQWIWEIDTTVTPPTEWWKKVWTMEIDLTQYYTKDETDEKFLQIKDEKVLVYPFVWMWWPVDEMIEKLKEWKAIVMSTYDDQDPDSAEFGWISEFTDTYFVVERPTQRETYTYDANFEVTNISIDDEPPLYRRDYRFGGNETDRLIRNIFTQAKTYNNDTELELDENITVYSEWMFYKLLVTNNSLTDPITLTLDSEIQNPMDLDLTIPAEETVLYMLMRVGNQFNLVWSSYELSGSLSNYYKKTETYNKTEIDALLDEKQDLLHDLWTVGAVVPQYKLAMLDLVWNWVSHINVDTLYNYYKAKLDGAVSNVLETDFSIWNRAVVSNPQGKFAICDTTTEEINYVHWVTSNIQDQLDDKQDKLSEGTRITTVDDNTDFTQVDLANESLAPVNAKAIFDYMWKKIYPVGSIYITMSLENPATLFWWTWEQLWDRFLLWCGSTYNVVNSTWWSDTITLTRANLPNVSISTSSAGKKTFDLNGVRAFAYKWWWENNKWWLEYWKKELYEKKNYGSSEETASNHTHSFNLNGNVTQTSISIMPPYRTVLMWKRTA